MIIIEKLLLYFGKKWLFTLSLASLVLWVIFLGNLPLRDWDEGTVAQVAREIWRAPAGSMRWLYPVLAGEPYHNKPTLIHLLIAGAYSLGGVNEWTTRLPCAILTAMGVPLLYRVGHLLFRQHLPAIFSALVYLTMLPVVRHGRLAMLDGASISFFLMLLFFLLKARKQKLYALGVGICLGLITLTKGMLVLLLGAIAGLFVILTGQLSLLKNPYFWTGMFLGSAAPITWYTAQWQNYGDNFLQINFQNQTFNRLVEVVEGNSGPPWYYLIELVKYGFPWLLFLPGSIYLAIKKHHTSWARLVLIGITLYFLTISVMKTKLPWYIMPVYPFLAIAVGAKLSEVWEHSHLIQKYWAFFLMMLGLGGVGGFIYFLIVDSQLALIMMSVVLSISMGIAAWLIKKGDRLFIPVLFCGTYLVLFLFMTSQSWIWELNESFPVKPIAALIRDHVTSGTQIYTSFPYARPSLDFYCDCRVIPLSLTVLAQKWSEKSYLLVDNGNLENLNLSNFQVLGQCDKFILMHSSK